jgi:hypothetical protein
MRFFAGMPLGGRRTGLPPVARASASALFQFVSQRFLETSIVIRRIGGGSWSVILADTIVAAAMDNLLLHRSVVLNRDGDSTAS